MSRKPHLLRTAAMALALAGGLAMFGGGCSATSGAAVEDTFPAADEADAGTSGDGSVYGPGANGGANPAFSTDAGAQATRLRGSPLCGWQVTVSPCFPDEVPVESTRCADPTTSADAGSAPGDAVDGSADPRIACHVVQAPSSNDVAPTCLPAGPKGEGDACLKSTDCASGFECIGSPGQCLHYCCDGTCSDAAREFCDIKVAVGGLKVPVCTAIGACKLLAMDACAKGRTCAIVNDDGATSCVDVGPAKVGESCETQHCADGLTCLGRAGSRTCFQLCNKSANGACAHGQTCAGYAPQFRDPDVGVCQ